VVCPVDCIEIHPEFKESEEALMSKYRALTAQVKS
jgi:hypothetical protein